jgi:hypothetical protein
MRDELIHPALKLHMANPLKLCIGMAERIRGHRNDKIERF